MTTTLKVVYHTEQTRMLRWNQLPEKPVKVSLTSTQAERRVAVLNSIEGAFEAYYREFDSNYWQYVSHADLPF